MDRHKRLDKGGYEVRFTPEVWKRLEGVLNEAEPVNPAALEAEPATPATAVTPAGADPGGMAARSERVEARFGTPEPLDEVAKQLENALLAQKLEQRDRLLRFVSAMTVCSFGLLVLIVLGQMVARWFDPGYAGVSDAVVNTLTVSVFGQVIGIVASIVVAVWKDPTGQGSNQK